MQPGVPRTGRTTIQAGGLCATRLSGAEEPRHREKSRTRVPRCFLQTHSCQRLAPGSASPTLEDRHRPPLSGAAAVWGWVAGRTWSLRAPSLRGLAHPACLLTEGHLGQGPMEVQSGGCRERPRGQARSWDGVEGRGPAGTSGGWGLLLLLRLEASTHHLLSWNII